MKNRKRELNRRKYEELKRYEKECVEARGKRIALTLLELESKYQVRVRTVSTIDTLDNNSKVGFVLQNIKRPNEAIQIVRGYYKKSDNKKVYILAPSPESPVEECSVYTGAELYGWFEEIPTREDLKKEIPMATLNGVKVNGFLVYSSLMFYLRKLGAEFSLDPNHEKKKDIYRLAVYSRLILGENKKDAISYGEKYIKDFED